VVPDNFEAFFEARQQNLLNLIGKAMGKAPFAAAELSEPKGDLLMTKTTQTTTWRLSRFNMAPRRVSDSAASPRRARRRARRCERASQPVQGRARAARSIKLKMSAASPGVKSPLATASRIAARAGSRSAQHSILGKSKELERRTGAIRHIAEFVDDEQFDGGELRVEF
jgi:hypothetical protein